MDMKVIYLLRDPVTDAPKYVGVTSQPVEDRLRRHISEAFNRSRANESKSAWIRDLVRAGNRPRIEIIEDSFSHPEARGFIRESYWIDKFEDEGIPLLNLAQNPKGKYRARG